MVEKEYKDIYSVGVTCIFLSSFLAIFLGIGSNILYEKCGNDGYIAAIIGGIISIILFYIFNYIFSKNTEENIYSLNEKIYGKVLGKILNLFMFVAFFSIACVILYNISNFLNIEYLPEINVNFIKALVLIPIIYISSKSLSDIIKTNQIFAIISIIIILLDILGLFQKFDFNNLEPVLQTSKINIVKSVAVYVILSIVPYSMLLITSKNKVKDKDRVSKVIFKGIVLTNIIQIIIIFCTILVLGEKFISAFRFPEYIALKQFSLFNILERVENILSLQFYFSSTLLLTFLFRFLIEFLPKNNLKKYYSIIISAILYVVTSLIFKEAISFAEIINKYIFYVILIGIMCPVILTFLKIRKNNKNT
jgi:spore germination protein KB